MFTPDAPSQPDDLDPRVEQCRRVVETLLDVGMKLVRSLDPEQGVGTVRDPIQAYCRLSWALRLALMLEARLARFAADGAAARAAERDLAQQAEEQAEEAGDDEAGDGPEMGERGERGESARPDREAPDGTERFLTRPITELAAAVCRDLDLAPAEALEVQAAFAELTANDDTEPPEPSVAGPGRYGSPRERRRRPGGRGWTGSRSQPPDLPL